MVTLSVNFFGTLNQKRVPLIMVKPIIVVYCDGASSGKSNKPGGWGVVLLSGDQVLTKASGNDPSTTNNRMELQAAISGIELVSKNYPDHDVVVYSDSAYVIDSMKNDRPWSWGSSNWKTSTGSDVKNKDLWLKMMSVLKRGTNVEWRHVKGHSGNVHNEECDRLAKEAKLSIKEVNND